MERLTHYRSDCAVCLNADGVKNNTDYAMLVQTAVDKLAAYEDAEEQGFLVWRTKKQKEAADRLSKYSADDNFFDDEYC